MKSKPPAPTGDRKRAAQRSWFALNESDERKALLWILAAALLLRVIYLLQLKGSIFWGNYILDSQALDLWGKEIAAGNLVGTEPFFRAPLYGYLLGLVYAIFGSGPVGIIIVQMLCGLAVVYLTFVYARRLFDKKVALISAAITAAWPTLIFYEGEVSITTLEVLVGLAALICIHRAVELRTARSLIAAGVAVGLAAITRPTFLVLVPLLPLGMWFSAARMRLGNLVAPSAIFVAAMLVPILPVTFHNVVFGNDFVLIASQGGSNFYLGNSAAADGITAQQIGVAQLDGVMQDNIASVAAAEREVGRKLKPSEASSYWLGRTFDDIWADPARALGLFLKKCYLFWHGQEIFNNKSLYYAGEYSLLMRLLLWKAGVNFPSGLLFPLMLCGIFLVFRNRLAIPVPLGYLGSYMLAIALFFVCARFRQPIVPLAIIIASFAIVSLFRALKTREWRASLPAFGVFVAGLIALNWGGNVESRANLSQFDTILGSLYLRQRDLPRAIDRYESAITLVPQNVRVYSQLGRAYTETGQFERAIGAFQRGIAQAPDYPPLRYNLGIALTRFGRLEEAKSSFRDALLLSPKALDARLALAEVYELQQHRDSALTLYREILELAPQHQVANQKVRLLEASAPPAE